jgi:LPS-assembly protein
MGRSIDRPDQGGRRGCVVARLALALALLMTAFAAATSAVGSAEAQAASTRPQSTDSQKPPATEQAQTAARNPDKLYIEADQLVYDRDHDKVTAIGNVVLYYKGRVLQADRVVYDRASKRVMAEGHAKLTDEHGGIVYSPKFDLTDDFASGFAEGVQVLNTNKTRLSSPRIERSAGSITVFDQGVYTACEPCKAHPEWPPEWQVRAAKIIENQQTHMVYFENAWLDVYGVPIAYVPYFSAPDPTVTRQSGVLAPAYTSQSALGFGLSVPYFLALAPNYDLTVTPSYYTLQGPALDLLWRQRLDYGSYSVRVSGIDEMNPQEFLAAPFGAGDQAWRGSLESDGKFYINDKWTYGWDFKVLSDRFYLNDYRLTQFDPTSYYYQDIVSSVYLRGQDGRGFFDLSGYHFQTTTAYVDQRQDPNAVPVLDYNRTFAVDPAHSGGLGGEVTVDLNTANINRTEALYQSVGTQQYDKAYGVYGACTNYRPGTAPADCLLRGIAGDYARATGQVSWQRRIVDPVGEVWTPFAFARVSGESTNLNTSQNFVYASSYGLSDIPNSAQPAFFNGASAGSTATAMPGVGLEYRYPFVSNSPIGQQTIEPIAQLIVRPNEYRSGLMPNEDAQSLVFDETNLFAWSKYSGYDRIEGGTRANYGLQYTANFADGGHANFVGGQSVQLAGQNSYTIADDANAGLESGLDKTFSNYVLGETVQPFSAPLSFTSKQQLDSSTYALDRLDGIISANLGGLTASVDYGRYAPQPLLGFPHERQGLITGVKYKINDQVAIDGGLVLDLSRYLFDVPGQTEPVFYPSNFNVGISYTDTCTTFRVAFSSVMTDPVNFTTGIPTAPAVRNTSLLFELTLRTLGDIKGSAGVD